jgi:AAA15 family ATPase/GTPase
MMKQLAYLLNFTVSGIKNIEKPVHLEFYKKGVDTDFDADQYRIKAIYGENGSGKTGIVPRFTRSGCSNRHR